MKIPSWLRPYIQRFLLTKVGQLSIRFAISLFASKHRIGVNVICMDHDHRVLLLKHVFHPFAPWGLPGGWMDHLENPRSCAQRELMEETGLSADDFQVLEVFHSQKPHHINIIFMTRLDSEEAGSKIRLQANEISDFKWYGPDNLPEPLSKHTYNALRKAWESVEIPLTLDENQIVHTPF